jgi:hypothetical protein
LEELDVLVLGLAARKLGSELWNRRRYSPGRGRLVRMIGERGNQSPGNVAIVHNEMTTIPPRRTTVVTTAAHSQTPQLAANRRAIVVEGYC